MTGVLVNVVVFGITYWIGFSWCNWVAKKHQERYNHWREEL